MNLDISAFSLGFHDKMSEKKGASSNFLDNAVNENILPHISSQTNWKYVQTPEGLKLSDGHKVYNFGLKDFGGESTRVPKLDDSNIFNFENNKTSGGTAQIHRSSPDSIYMTLANGRENPTFSLEHSEGKDWKYLPSKKMIKRLAQLRATEESNIPQVDPNALIQGGLDEIKQASLSIGENMANGNGIFGGADGANEFLWKGINGGKNILQGISNHPGLAIGGTVLGGLLLNRLRKRTNPEYAEKMQNSPAKELTRSVGLPLLLGAGVVGLGALTK
jgi:hypothetical protein